MYAPPKLTCFLHRQQFVNGADDSLQEGQRLICPAGCGVPVVAGIPRFVTRENYAAGFGLQWKQFRNTQLDSYTGTTISKDRLTSCLGGSLDVIKGKSVLE